MSERTLEQTDWRHLKQQLLNRRCLWCSDKILYGNDGLAGGRAAARVNVIILFRQMSDLKLINSNYKQKLFPTDTIGWRVKKEEVE